MHAGEVVEVAGEAERRIVAHCRSDLVVMSGRKWL